MSFKEGKEKLKTKHITLLLFYIKPTPMGDIKGKLYKKDLPDNILENTEYNLTLI